MAWVDGVYVPEDTSKRHPLLHLAGAMSEGNSGYIEGMEAEGQRQLVNSTVLPHSSSGYTKNDAREALEAIGVKCGDAVDDLFMQVELPEGWTREGTEHAMHSYVLDERGLKRIHVFYKAAFYDRSAHCSVLNAGREEATRFLYSEADGVTTDDIRYDVLTTSERAGFHKALADMGESLERHPDIYADRKERYETAVATWGEENSRG